MEGLGWLITEEHRRGRVYGIMITDECTLTHLLFVDDVLIFLNRSVGDINSIRDIVPLFQKVTGMIINEGKSTLTVAPCTQHEIHYALDRFNFTLIALEEGLKYLGYKLKSIGYKIADWTWLIAKLEKRLSTWYLRFLSCASYLTLIKSVLEATLVYWMSLAWIPRGILARIQNLCSRFLWRGNQPGRIFAWAKWDPLTLPKNGAAGDSKSLVIFPQPWLLNLVGSWLLRTAYGQE